MDQQQNSQVPNWFWVAAGMALIWNLMGVAAFVSAMTLSPEALAAMPQQEAEIYASTPLWANVAFGIAVLGGALGCVALLMKKALAKPLFIASLCGVSVQMFHAYFISHSFEVFGSGGMIMPVMVIVVAIALLWFAGFCNKKGWI